MTTGVKRILGFERDEQTARPYWNRTEVEETLLVDAYNVTDNVLQIIDTLPAYGSPGDTTFNPLQITLTLYRSVHPKSNSLFLLDAPSVEKEKKTGIRWKIKLRYSNFIPSEILRINKDTNTPIVNPLDEPVVHSSSSNIVQKQTVTKPNGDFILHANGLPVDTPIAVEETHTVHTWKFNVLYADTNLYTDFYQYCGKIGSTTTFGVAGQKWKFTHFNSEEVYTTVGSGNTKTTYHYLKITLSMEYNPSGWADDAKLISMHTMQLAGGLLIPIDINGNGDRAQNPWPLLEDGTAAQYDDLTASPFAELDTGYPQTADLATNLVTAYGLYIP